MYNSRIREVGKTSQLKIEDRIMNKKDTRYWVTGPGPASETWGSPVLSPGHG